MSLKNKVKRFSRFVRLGTQVRSSRWLLFSALGIRSTVAVEILGMTINVRTSTPDLEVAISCLNGEFDDVCEELPVLRHGIIVDAGGYIGTAAIAFARKYPKAKIITIEPSSQNYSILLKNIAAWPNIIPMNKALAPEPGKLILHDRGTGEWGFTLIDNAADRATSPAGEVECVTVAQVMDQVGSDGIDIFKIDIEGGEHALLTRNTDWISKTSGICIELHDRIVPNCSEVWEAAMVGRHNLKSSGEKFISLRKKDIGMRLPDLPSVAA
jgi:FkbM family methyltransferase